MVCRVRRIHVSSRTFVPEVFTFSALLSLRIPEALREKRQKISINPYFLNEIHVYHKGRRLEGSRYDCDARISEWIESRRPEMG
jgi:hypothetical protein